MNDRQRATTSACHRASAICRVILGLAIAGIGVAQGAEPALVDVVVYPQQVHLSSAEDRPTLVVQATYADGITRDVTSQATLSLAHPDRAALEGGQLKPLADGDTVTDLIEVKRADPVPSAYLHRMAQRFTSARAVQVVEELRQPAQHGLVEVVSAAPWLAGLAG